jgi:hypothetical protein
MGLFARMKGSPSTGAVLAHAGYRRDADYRAESTAFAVAGDDRRQKELTKLARRVGPEGVGGLLPMWLVPEPNNPHDKNALRVECHGVHIGYYPRGEKPSNSWLSSRIKKQHRGKLAIVGELKEHRGGGWSASGYLRTDAVKK